MTQGLPDPWKGETDTTKKALLMDTRTAINVFLASQQDNGTINGIDYWQVANGYTAIALHDLWSSTDTYKERLQVLLATVEAHHPKFVNEFNDDSMWWAMTNLELWELTKEVKYFLAATDIWRHVQPYVVSKSDKIIIDGENMKHAVRWNTRDDGAVNSITTGLFAELTARLALDEDPPHRQRMIDSALSNIRWILRCRCNISEYVVLDTINLKTHEHTDWTFTYTTGQFLAATIAIFDALAPPDVLVWPAEAEVVLKLACDFARAAMHRPQWIQNGILVAKEEYPADHSVWENNDAVGFKSILVRSLAKLYRVLEREEFEDDLRQAIRSFVCQQFNSLQTRNSNESGQYGPYWDGPFTSPTSHSQLAVLDVMAAIHAVDP